MISALNVTICAFTTEAGHSPDMERTQRSLTAATKRLKAITAEGAEITEKNAAKQ